MRSGNNRIRTLSRAPPCRPTGGECLATFQGHSAEVNTLAFSPDGRTIVSGSRDETLKLWSVSGGECLKTFSHDFAVESAAFSPDGRTVLSASDITLQLWGAPSQTEGSFVKTGTPLQ